MNFNEIEHKEVAAVEDRAPEEVLEGSLSEAQHTRACEIASGGNYEKIRDTLRSEELLADEVGRVREVYGALLEGAEWMTPEDWEMLAIMDCYDKSTADHCVETYRIARDRIERFTMGDKKFSEMIEGEGIPLSEFYRACLFHDIGKCCIPHSILHNHLTDAEFGKQLCEDVFLGGKKEILADVEAAAGEKFEGEWGNSEELQEFLKTHHIHTMRFVPVREVLSEEDIAVVAMRFPEIDLETATLADLFVPHEEESERILKAQGCSTAADIAGKHHNYRNLSVRFPITTGTLGVSAALEEILALSDMEQAMSGRRAYQKRSLVSGESLPMSIILCDMIAEVQTRNMNPVITTFWVTQELATISEEERLQNPTAIAEIEQFITLHQKEIDQFLSVE